MRNAVTRDPGALACSLVPPLPVTAPVSCLQPSVLAWQPLEMELPLASPASCELRSVIRFLCAKNTPNCVKSTEKSV
jgi:hypothetical protein